MIEPIAETNGQLAKGLSRGLEDFAVDTNDPTVIDENAEQPELVGLECSECHFLDVPSAMYRHWGETGHCDFTEIFH